MKNSLTIRHDTREIVMDRTFAKFAMNTRSEEYAHLQQVRKDYPTYTVKQRQIKRNANKKTYNGLTYEWMEDYILTHGTAEESEKILNEFNEMRLIAECHSKAFRYPVIKKWFLGMYPEIVRFGVADKPKTIVEGEEKAAADNVVDMPKAAGL